MIPPDLDSGLLVQILERVRDAENVPVDKVVQRLSTTDLLGLVESMPEGEARAYINQHIRFLFELEYLRGGDTVVQEWRNLSLTAKGRLFLQPELAGFAGYFWPQVVNIVEQHIHQAPVSEADKQGWLEKLREVALQQAPDLLVELLKAVLRSQGS